MITFCLEQLGETGNLDSNLIFHQCKLDLMARFKEINLTNPKLKHDQIAKEQGLSSSTLKR